MFCVVCVFWLRDVFVVWVQFLGRHEEYPIQYPASNTVAVLWECQNGSGSMHKVRSKQCFFFQTRIGLARTIFSPQPTMSHLRVIKALVAEGNQSHGGCYINTHDFLKCWQSVMKSDMLGRAHHFGRSCFIHIWFMSI